MSDYGEIVRQLRDIIQTFDDDVADELNRESERADLWTSVDAPVDLLRAAASALSGAIAAKEAAERERDEARARLFPYADDKQISGMSWSGFYLIGDDKSIKELRRLENVASQVQVWRQGFDEHMAAATARAEAAEARLSQLEADARKATSVLRLLLGRVDAVTSALGPGVSILPAGAFKTNDLVSVANEARNFLTTLSPSGDTAKGGE